MRIHFFGHTFLTLLLTTASVPVISNLAFDGRRVQVLAQTLYEQQTEQQTDLLYKIELSGGEYNVRHVIAAKEYWEKALLFYRERKDRKSEGNVLNQLGVAYRNLGDYPKAIDYYQQSLKIAREIKNRQDEVDALNNLGVAYRNLGDYPKAIDYYQQSLKIAREETKERLSKGNAWGNFSEGHALGNLGEAYRNLGDYPKAIDYSQQYLKIAREVRNFLSEGDALGNLGLAYYSLGDYPKAIDYYQQSLKIARLKENRLGEGQLLNNLGLAFYKTGNLKLAESTLFQGIKVYESLRGKELKDNEKVEFFDTQRDTYRSLQQVLIAQNKNNAALEIAERARGRAFVELLRSKIPLDQLQSPILPTIAEIRKIAKAQNATLVQYSIVDDDFKVQGKSQTQESELYIWVIKPTGEVTFRKADLKALWQKDNIKLASLVDNSRLSIGARGRGGRSNNVAYNPNAGKNSAQGDKKLKQLHQLLISPIADLLPKNENDKVIFIPQGSLFLVPFPALQDENGKHLIEKHTILTASAIQVLDLTHQQKQKVIGKGALVVGNPAISPQVNKEYGLDPLNGAEQEAIKVGKILKTQPILEKNATKAQVLQRMQQAKVIHLATHGLLDDVKKLGVPGAIVLAPGGKDDGLLTASEILDLKLSADLVVLSACDTGQGKLTGDGVVGLSRSLISAGTASVIVTLWKIPDEATSELMGDFYQNLQRNPDKAVALRRAMLSTMKKYPKAVNWAAFTLIGEAE